jgi:predicted CoA-binding protein
MNKPIVVILGASIKPERYANKAQRLLMQKGYTVIPVHPQQKEIEGVSVVKKLSDITEQVDTVTLYINPKVSQETVSDLIALKPRRVIFNPGSESPELESLLKQQGVLAPFSHASRKKKGRPTHEIVVLIDY